MNNISKKNIGFISGNFNVLHPGHVRLIKFAKENVEFLIVAVTDDSAPGVSVKQHLRAEALAQIKLVDKVIKLSGDLLDTLRDVRPDFVIKGSEFKDIENIEELTARQIGAELLFSSGDPVLSATDLIDKEKRPESLHEYNNVMGFVHRHSISPSELIKNIIKFKNLKVTVIGDIIVDNYLFCEPLGMSQEDPTIVVKKIEECQYLGGAAIVAGHAAALGASVNIVGLVGNDDVAKFAELKLKEFNVKSTLFTDSTRPTTLKRKYRAGGKTLLRVNTVADHDLSEEIRLLVIEKTKPLIEKSDAVIFSDFNYGFLTKKLAKSLIDICADNHVLVAADSQTSSQIGDLGKFYGVNLITPTEVEARLTVNEKSCSITQLPLKLQSLLGAQNIMITMGADGVLVSAIDKGEEFTDRLPTFNSNPVDVSGAGDSFIASSTLSLAAGLTVWEAAFLASQAASVQISRIGNRPIEVQDLLLNLRQIS